jgi:inner membrane protein involved in colicin E2 resistance
VQKESGFSPHVNLKMTYSLPLIPLGKDSEVKLNSNRTDLLLEVLG